MERGVIDCGRLRRTGYRLGNRRWGAASGSIVQGPKQPQAAMPRHSARRRADSGSKSNALFKNQPSRDKKKRWLMPASVALFSSQQENPWQSGPTTERPSSAEIECCDAGAPDVTQSGRDGSPRSAGLVPTSRRSEGSLIWFNFLLKTDVRLVFYG